MSMIKNGQLIFLGYLKAAPSQSQLMNFLSWTHTCKQIKETGSPITIAKGHNQSNALNMKA